MPNTSTFIERVARKLSSPHTKIPLHQFDRAMHEIQQAEREVRSEWFSEVLRQISKRHT